MSVAYHAATLGDVTPAIPLWCSGPDRSASACGSRCAAREVEDTFVVEPSAIRRAAIEALGARTLDPVAVDVPAFVADHTGGRGADAVYDAAGVAPAVASALACVGARSPMVSVAIYEKPLTTPLLNLVMKESRIQGSLCYTSADFEAVIALMARDAYDTTGWVDLDRHRRRHRPRLRSAARRDQDEGPRRPVLLSPMPGWQHVALWM